MASGLGSSTPVPLTYEQWFKEADKDSDGFLSTKELKAATKSYKLKAKQFKEYFKNLDLDGDKKISLDEYMSSMGLVPEAYHKEALIRQAFEKADMDKDGFLDVGEMNAVLQGMKQFLEPDALMTMVNKMDKDKNGKIDFNEFLVHFLKENGFTETKEDETREAFDKADTSGDGVLDLEEIKVIMQKKDTGLNNKQIFDLMHKADKNKDGLIQYDEFVDMMKQEGAFKE